MCGLGWCICGLREVACSELTASESLLQDAQAIKLDVTCGLLYVLSASACGCNCGCLCGGSGIPPECNIGVGTPSGQDIIVVLPVAAAGG